MTNEEPVPSTSSVLSAAEKNVKIEPVPASKKRKGLDIDALWRKKFKDVENHKSPDKTAEPSTSSSDDKAGPSEPAATSEETSKPPSAPEAVVVKKPEPEASSPETAPPKEPKVVVQKVEKMAEPSKPAETIKSALKITTTPARPVHAAPTKGIKKQAEVTKPAAPAPPPKETSPVGRRTTRSAQKKTVEAGKKAMNDLEDIKPNIKLLKKGLPAFQCSNIDDGSVREVPTSNTMRVMDPQKITLLQHHNSFGDESQDEMEVMQRSGDESNGDRDDYEYEQAVQYTGAVTPSSYTIYAPDSAYGTYYQQPLLQYATNSMQASPQDASSAAYLVPAPQSPISNEDQETGAILQNSQRASPATVNWLFDNYEIAEGSSLPRCQLYDHYKSHCEEHRMDPVNAASFGKLIRSVFQNLKTRRLGTRGNSKYHYYGIRMKDTSILHTLPLQAQPIIHQQVYTPPMQQIQQRDVYADTVNQVAAQKYMGAEMIPMKRARRHSSSSSSYRDSSSPGSELPPQQIFLNHNTSAAKVIPTQVVASNATSGSYNFTEEDKAAMGKKHLEQTVFKHRKELLADYRFKKLNMHADQVDQFVSSYDNMCRITLNSVKEINFAHLEDVWKSFWNGEMSSSDHESFLALCTLEQIQDWVVECDLNLYQTIVDCLIPHVLLSELSAGMTQSCRTFGKNIDHYLRKAMIHGKVCDSLMKKKLQALKYMQQGLKRYTSLNHLAHAARGVLMKPEQCLQMAQDYSKVDIESVHQQAGWICGCDGDLVRSINVAFQANLHGASPMSKWAEWLESIVDQVLAKYHDKPAKDVENVGKQFLLNWSFYTSMIIRDLTLRSAMSFGSFTLIRLLADDYMYYLIESKIAKASNQQLITVIRQEKEWPLTKPQASQEYIVPSKNAVVDNGISS